MNNESRISILLHLFSSLFGVTHRLWLKVFNKVNFGFHLLFFWSSSWPGFFSWFAFNHLLLDGSALLSHLFLFWMGTHQGNLPQVLFNFTLLGCWDLFFIEIKQKWITWLFPFHDLFFTNFGLFLHFSWAFFNFWSPNWFSGGWRWQLFFLAFFDLFFWHLLRLNWQRNFLWRNFNDFFFLGGGDHFWCGSCFHQFYNN